MSEQTANLCTTDACESLRARLAKYEDADGNQISTMAEQAREIERLKEGQSILILARDDQKRLANEYRELWSRVAVKAQPGGVVLPELRERETGEYGDAFARGWKAYEREYKRLNSSPVSAVCDTCHGQGEVWTGENQSFGYMSMQPPEPIMEACPECSGELVRPASAGDDRKLSDIGNELHNLSCHVVHHNEGWANQIGTLASELWNWQARATHPADQVEDDLTMVKVSRELLQDLRDLAFDQVEHHRAAMGAYKQTRQSAMDSVLAQADALLRS